MSRWNEFCRFGYCEYHKGFYNDGTPRESLLGINYSDFWKLPDDDDFPYECADSLLSGSCQFFALSLKKLLGYNPYIIQENNGAGFHAFCQIYKDGKWYYVDARGVTSCFSEFMEVAKIFVTDEYTIRPVTPDLIEEWEKDSKYNAEAYAIAEAVIEKYKECYILG